MVAALEHCTHSLDALVYAFASMGEVADSISRSFGVPASYFDEPIVAPAPPAGRRAIVFDEVPT